VFKIYKQEFVCNKCGESSCMGIVGYSDLFPNICDLCLVNDSEEVVIQNTFGTRKFGGKFLALIVSLQKSLSKKNKQKIN